MQSTWFVILQIKYIQKYDQTLNIKFRNQLKLYNLRNFNQQNMQIKILIFK